MKDGIELGKVINQLRTEILELTRTAGGEDLRFALESIEVELHVGVTKEDIGGVKAKFWVLEAGGEAKYSTDQTQTIKLTLKPNGETLVGRGG